jgi:antitoxin (DNA-binding transcriptional repressor) of toxin-antitoxin stability system
MSSKLDLEDAQERLQEIVAGLNPGEPLTITKDGEPVATLTRSSLKTWPCKAGSAKDTLHWLAADFNSPLEIEHTKLSERTI